MPDPLRITSDETRAAEDDRFHRLRLIGWWDQQRLARAKVLVVGAGALGNEILKNLALLGVGQVLIVDSDRVENSNLSRSVLYRQRDNGRFKAEAAAAAASDIYPDMRVHAYVGNVVYDLGMGVYSWADLVLGGLDNREARLAINRACWKTGTPFIDGAIESIQGCVRMFTPDGPCYECTMSEVDWKIVQQRRSCNLLSRDEMEQGKTPTTPTISSVIAGVQCQEAVKHLHGLPTLAGKAWYFEGLSGDSYQVELQRKDDCYSHEMFDQIVTLNEGVAQLTARQLLDQATERLGPVELEFARDMLSGLTCPQCGQTEPRFQSLGQTRSEQAFCPHCSGVRREISTYYKIRGDEPFLDRTLAELGTPLWDTVIARRPDRIVGLELGGDAAAVLGPLAAGEEDLQWT
ncbi:HesA/MoeB/ThiF family protein [Lignipirellula cremea]|uniref:Putative adenylyltransferase/sulfurtransferase MoeZ n=1 Tax=Lignipirellula cremea TaxID=2528010 RepID=A0A518DNF7_9BACT|nr:ThiF family adenylyltransferase [Lignipirellula cremea]QDU93378.1 putative adenylyltransferase/sulfurtransferase MoeZ [Lignipirellula cremea]